MRVRLRSIIAALILLCLAPVVLLCAFLLVRVARQQIWREANTYAVSIANTVLSATRHSMLTVDRTELEAIIDAVSRQTGVRTVRLYDGAGRFRAPEARAAPDLDLSGPECTSCHPDPRQMPPPLRACAHRDQESLRLFQPVPNEPECLGSGCHSASDRFLGLMEVDIDVSEALARSRRLTVWAILWGLVILGLAVVPLVVAFRRTMEKPLADCLRIVRGVARGDLSVRSLLTPATEWGELLAALDSMTGALQKARTELEALNRDLEAQVAVRTKELEAALEEVRESDRVKSEFLTGISHEFATPLQGAIGYAELLLDGIEGELKPGQRHDVDAILRNCRNLLALVEDLLEIARFGRGLRESPPRPVPLEPIAREAVESGRRLAAGTAVEVTLEPTTGCPSALGDPGALRHLVYHLVEYAVRNSDTGRVDLELRPDEEGYVEVWVSVTGSASHADVLRSALSGYSPGGGGAGLGIRLALARRLIELRGGALFVESIPGNGTRARVRLPTFDEKAASPD